MCDGRIKCRMRWFCTTGGRKTAFYTSHYTAELHVHWAATSSHYHDENICALKAMTSMTKWLRTAKEQSVRIMLEDNHQPKRKSCICRKEKCGGAVAKEVARCFDSEEIYMTLCFEYTRPPGIPCDCLKQQFADVNIRRRGGRCRSREHYLNRRPALEQRKKKTRRNVYGAWLLFLHVDGEILH